MKQIYKTKEEKARMEDRIQEMKDAFYKEFGCRLIIVLKDQTDYRIRMKLEELEECVNAALDKTHPGLFPKGIRTNSRKSVLVNYRYCFFMLARKMRYTTIKINQHMHFHHATILYGSKLIANHLSVSDEQTIINLNSIYDELKERYGIDGNLYVTGQEQDHS